MTKMGFVVRRTAQVFGREPWWAEFWSALTAIAWAGLSYFGTQDLAAWPSMQGLLRIGGDQFWHRIGFGLGLVQVVVLTADHRWLRWGVAIAMSWFWAVLTLGVWIAVPWAPGAVVYAGWCGINVFSILRLLRHHG